MAGADPGAVVAMEVLVEQEQVVPVRVALELLDPAEHRPPARLVLGERRDQSPADLPRPPTPARRPRGPSVNGVTSRRPISLAPSSRFIRRPEPVGQSTRTRSP